MIPSSKLVEHCAGKRVFIHWGGTFEVCRPPEPRNVREGYWAAFLALNIMEQSGGAKEKAGAWILAQYPDRVVIGPTAQMRMRMDVLETHFIEWDGFGTLADWAAGGAQ